MSYYTQQNTKQKKESSYLYLFTYPTTYRAQKRENIIIRISREIFKIKYEQMKISKKAESTLSRERKAFMKRKQRNILSLES